MSVEFSASLIEKDGEYVLSVAISAPAIVWVEIGSERFRDESLGALRSVYLMRNIPLHKYALMREGEYTLCVKEVADMNERCVSLGDLARKVYSFP